MRIRVYKRIFYSLLVVFLWLGFVVDGAHALFSDSAILTNNAILTGTVDLLISNSQNPSSTIYEDNRPGFTFDLSPGQTQEKYFLLKNASAADVPFNIDVTANLPGATNDLSANTTLQIQPVDADGLPLSDGIHATLNDLWNQHSGVIATIAKGQTQRFKIRASLSPEFIEQNQTVSYDLVFTGLQDL